MAYSAQPLADKLRPTNLDMVFGQQHLLGKGKPIRAIYEKGHLPNMIFYGVPGVGKTTVAKILSEKSGFPFFEINATTASTKDIQDILKSQSGSVVLYVDEIQYFNKKQQQSLLNFIETGKMVLIASTTENPAFYVYNALLSRCLTFEFKPLTSEDIKMAVKAAIDAVEFDDFKALNILPESIDFICDLSDGDVRKAINIIELMALVGFSEKDVTPEMIAEITNKKVFKHDKDGDNHYNIISAFQKSIRGSDPDAALHYLARLIVGGDIQIACRRLLVIASEDIGLANPEAASVVHGCVQNALSLGMPEARIPLAEATIYLATSPKSNSAIMAIDAALADLEQGIGDIPDCLKDSHYKRTHTGPSYLYPHEYPNHWVKQQYLPDNIKDKVYYEYQNNKRELAAKEYWDKIKDKTKES